MEFTKKQELAIAEFIFSYETDVLITSDAQNLINVFQEHHVPEAYVANISIEDCMQLIKDNISVEQTDEILKKYLSGKL